MRADPSDLHSDSASPCRLLGSAPQTASKRGRGADEIHMTRIQEMTGPVPDASSQCVSPASLADGPASLKCTGAK